MFINPRTHSPDAIASLQAQVSARYEAYRSGGGFDPLIQSMLGDFDKASQKTKDLIFGLKNLQGMTPAREKNGVFGVHTDDMAAEQGQLLTQFSRAAASLFQDYGIDTSRTISFGVTSDGRIEVTNAHPDAAEIETLVNGSGLLRGSIAKMLADQAILTAAENRDSGAARVTLSADGDTMTGIVEMYEDLFAGASKQTSTKMAQDKAKAEEQAEQERLTKAALEREWQMKAAIIREQLDDASQAKADERRQTAQDAPPTFI